jgi:hypothetical protein
LQPLSLFVAGGGAPIGTRSGASRAWLRA